MYLIQLFLILLGWGKYIYYIILFEEKKKAHVCIYILKFEIVMLICGGYIRKVKACTVKTYLSDVK
jgi:hypothetical protein